LCTSAVDVEVKEQGLTDSSLTDTASMQPHAMFPNYRAPNFGKTVGLSTAGTHQMDADSDRENG
jgi:hypothetical protein